MAVFFVFSASFNSAVSAEDKAIPISIFEIQNLIEKQETIEIYQRSITIRPFLAKNGNIIAMIAVPFLHFILG